MAWVIYGDKRFYLHDGETLLAGLLRQGVNTSFECRQGYCGACRLKVACLSGGLHHTLPPLCQLEEGEVLACCCMTSGTLKVV